MFLHPREMFLQPREIFPHPRDEPDPRETTMQTTTPDRRAS
jgi:hypothetical protein